MGFSSVTGDETIMFADNVSFDGTQRGGKVTTNGQLLIGATASPHIKVGSLTSPNATITIGYSSPNITLDAVSTAVVWNDISGAFAPTKNNGYFITGTATANLSGSPSQGDTVYFFVDHASQVLTIDAPGSALIRFGTLISSAGGTAVSTQQGDSCTLVYRAANTCWEAINFVGTWTIA